MYVIQNAFHCYITCSPQVFFGHNCGCISLVEPCPCITSMTKAALHLDINVQCIRHFLLLNWLIQPCLNLLGCNWGRVTPMHYIDIKGNKLELGSNMNYLTNHTKLNDATSCLWPQRWTHTHTHTYIST